MVDPSTVLQSDPDILGGAAVFRGTRVPARILFELLSAGDSLDELLDAHPSVSRDQAVAVLEAGRDRLLSVARTS